MIFQSAHVSIINWAKCYLACNNFSLTEKNGAFFSTAGDGCSVCCQDYVIGDVANVLPCNHNFHRDCIGSWLRTVSITFSIFIKKYIVDNCNFPKFLWLIHHILMYNICFRITHALSADSLSMDTNIGLPSPRKKNKIDVCDEWHLQ